MKPRDECLYYLVREMDDLGIRAKDVYFKDMIDHVKQTGLDGMRPVEIQAIVWAAIARGKEEELDSAVERSE